MESYQEQVLAFLKGELNDEEKRTFEESLARSTELRAELERSRELLDLMEAANEQATARRVEHHIGQALERRATHIPIIPGKTETRVYLPIHGALPPRQPIPPTLSPPLSS